MLLDPILTTQPPEVEAAGAEQLAKRYYGLDLQAAELAGERDRNFRMDAADGRQFLLKISNPAEDEGMVDLQISLLEHVRSRDPGLPVPRMVPTMGGRPAIPILLADGRSAILRMLTYLPGAPLSAVARSTRQRQALGRCLARLDLALAGFDHPAARHELLWNVSTAHRLGGMVASLADPDRRARVDRFMTRYVADILPLLDHLRAQMIHNDFNLGNVLVRPDATDEVAAIIDFGDAVSAPLAGEIATAAAYQLTDCEAPLLGAAEMIGAYHGVLALSDEELDLIPDLLEARLVITVLITEWRATRYPENRQYIMRNNRPAWNGLDALGRMSRGQIQDQLLQFCHAGEMR